MLNIRVLGSGLIPRGYGLAPRMEPFKADLILISTIIRTPGLEVQYENPRTGKFEAVSNKTLKKVWDTYSNRKVQQPTVKSSPVIPTSNTTETNPANDNPAVVHEKVESPAPVDQSTVAAINSDINDDQPGSNMTETVDEKTDGAQDSESNDETSDKAFTVKPITANTVLKPNSQGNGKHNKR